jgi:hypothetical protein
LTTTSTTSAASQCSTPSWSSTVSTWSSLCSTSGPTTSWPHTSVDFDDNPLFDEELDSEEAELIPDHAVVLDANPTSSATAVDTPFTCSPECLRLAVHSRASLFTPRRRSSPRPYRSSRGSRLLGCWTRSACCSTYTAWATVVSSS